MTILKINNLPAELREEDSFNYYCESCLFSDGCDYTLDIELPLKDCANNRKIFGYIERNPPKSASWPASLIIDGQPISGVAILTDVNTTSIKIQFVAGKSLSEDSSIDTLYIDAPNVLNDCYTVLDSRDTVSSLSEAMRTGSLDWILSGDFQNRLPLTQPQGGGSFMNLPSVALQWVNDTEDSLQNASNGPRTGWSWMPFLLPLARKLAQRVGFITDFSQWDIKGNPLRELIVCNVVPCSMAPQMIYQYRDALPHWTIREFFDKLGPALNGKFIIDTAIKIITFRRMDTWFKGLPVIAPDNVEDEFTITSSFGIEETDGEYIQSKPYRYADAGTQCWKYLDCPWIIKSALPGMLMEFSTMTELEKYLNLPNTDRINDKRFHGLIFHVKDSDSYYAIYAKAFVSWMEKGKYKVSSSCSLMQINQFGPQTDDDNDDYNELDVLPVPIWENQIHLAPSGIFDMTAYLMDGGNPADLYKSMPETIVNANSYDEALAATDAETYQTPVFTTIDNGEPEKASAAYDKLFIGYWPGTDGINNGRTLPETSGPTFSMRLNSGSAPYTSLPAVDESIKYTFGWLADSVPDVNSIFYIHGRYWLCRRLELTFTPAGRSKRITGHFYPLTDFHQ